MTQEVGPNIRWHGERGIILAVVTHMKQQASFGEEVKKLLRAVLWAEPGSPRWVDRTREVTVIVEIGLADFGDPDMIVVCWTEGKDPYVVFLEAKVTTYQRSMKSNQEGMTNRDFNSSINGQLSLKYRFAKSLQNVPERGICESREIYEHYRMRLGDKHGPRKLLKEDVIRVFRELGLIGIPESRCHYVGLTWDDEKHAFFKDPGVVGPEVSSPEEEYLPLLLDEQGRNQCRHLKSRIGWLSYSRLERALSLASHPEYMRARFTMLRTAEPGPEDYACRGRRGNLVEPKALGSETGVPKSLWNGYKDGPCRGD